MARIFVSYRRDDAATEAGRITDWLDRHFGQDEVFMDINTVQLGADFVATIEDAVDTIDALIAVIGQEWITVKDEDGRRRLDDPHDYVRLEIGNALRRQIRVIPVLVDGAAMPSATDLPADLQPLVRRNALELTNTQWRPGIQRLIDALDGIVTPKPPSTNGPGDRPAPAARRFGPAPFILTLVGAPLLLFGVFVQNSNNESLFRPRFGGAVNFHDSHALWRAAGIFTTLPTLGVVLIGLIGSLLAARDDRRQALGVGLLVAAGLQGTMLYAGVLGLPQGHKAGYALALLGGLAVLAAGAFCVFQLVRWGRTTKPDPPLGGLLTVSAVAGAAAMVVGMSVNFNGGGPAPAHRYASAVLDAHHGERWDLLVAALVAAAIPFLAAVLPASRELAGGALIGLGVGLLCVWPRFIAIPLMENRSIASFGVGGVIGLAGAAAILFAGLRARRPARRLESLP